MNACVGWFLTLSAIYKVHAQYRFVCKQFAHSSQATADNSARGGGGASDIVLKTRSLQITEHCFYFSWVLIKTIPRRVRAASATTSDVI